MSSDQRLALVALIVTIVAIAPPLLWPRRKRGVALVSVGVALTLVAIWGGLELQMLSPVDINPRVISFDSKFSGETHTFTISNRRDDDVYTVAFVIRIDSPSLTTDDFVLEMPKSSQRPIRDDANSSNFADTYGMACKDSRNRPVFTMSIYRLKGHDTREITMTRKASQPAVKVGVEVVTYANEAPLFKGQNRTMAPIDVAEPLTCYSMMFLLPGKG
jgi:hypothetical protein